MISVFNSSARRRRDSGRIFSDRKPKSSPAKSSCQPPLFLVVIWNDDFAGDDFGFQLVGAAAQGLGQDFFRSETEIIAGKIVVSAAIISCSNLERRFCRR